MWLRQRENTESLDDPHMGLSMESGAICCRLAWNSVLLGETDHSGGEERETASTTQAALRAGRWVGGESACLSGRTNRLPSKTSVSAVLWCSRAEQPRAYVWVSHTPDLTSAVLPGSCVFLSQAPRGPPATWILFLPNVVSSCILLMRAALSSERCTLAALCRKRWV